MASLSDWIIVGQDIQEAIEHYNEQLRKCA
jgi:hypothetical protein